MNCNTCNFNTSKSPVSVCCELNYPENCEKEIERIINLSKESKEPQEYKARKIDRETGKVILEGTMNSKGEYKWNE